MAFSKSFGSHTFMSNDEAATVAAEAKFPILPLPMRFLKLRFYELNQTSASPARSAAIPKQ